MEVPSSGPFPGAIAQKNEQNQKAERRREEPGIALLIDRQDIVVVFAWRQMLDQVEIVRAKWQGPCPRGSVGAARHLGNLTEGRFFQPSADQLAIVLQRTGIEPNDAGCVRIPDADGVYANTERHGDAHAIPPFGVADRIVAIRYQ